ncbi:hypothetical protein JRQ81_006783 [Phrynocephalus forsythii]|uniref:Zona pellucida sperm-binding protein 3 n=1 Tax=Phrynocephalus forsythii TaxID=171643 RepID=A0A9Q0XGZ9_9SAUR|nr:hypothetical protein JRQ81_006783 [Phrynocephalus forsythii]
MVFFGSPWYVLWCFAISVADTSSSWDFSSDAVAWRFGPQTPPPARLPYGHSWALVDVSEPRALSGLNPVHAQCGEAQVVVTVKRDLFGTGRLIQAADLALGFQGCPPTSYDAAEETVTFAVGLHECGSTLQMTPDSLVYSVTLYYRPSLGSNPVIVRTSPVEVPIECHYPRKDNVSSKAIQPTWIPLSSTVSAQQRLAFSLRLMNEDWSTESTSNRYQLGDVMYIQADVTAESHMDLRLFVDNCVATLSPDVDSSPRYVVVDHHGCLVDGRSDDSRAAFVSPRPRPESLQFTVDAFRFAGDIGNMEAEADVLIGPVILDVQKTPVHRLEDERRMGQGVHERFLLMILGLIIGTAFLAVASVILVFFLAGKKQKQQHQQHSTQL